MANVNITEKFGIMQFDENKTIESIEANTFSEENRLGYIDNDTENGENKTDDTQYIDQMKNLKNNQRMTQRSEKVHARKTSHQDMIITTFHALSAEAFVDDIPESLEGAQNKSDYAKWKEAVDEEMDCLIKNKTWTVVDK
ncbi:hypothetical protein QE152_g36096 [Popillia japonica]|uniref:Gag-pol polyprotein n=1 Tax=Popillia japonica TaxID=7064 RepID=A0AAW1IDP6_POPJA